MEKLEEYLRKFNMKTLLSRINNIQIDAEELLYLQRFHKNNEELSKFYYQRYLDTLQLKKVYEKIINEKDN